MGLPRPGQEAVDGILAIVECDECILMFGESIRAGLEDFMAFGPLFEGEISLEDKARLQSALKEVRKLGLPRSWDPDWGLC